MRSRILIAITLINLTIGSCSSSDNKNFANEEVREVCQSFAKAICTKDTVTFFNLVDKAYLTTSMNEWMIDAKKLTQDNLFFPFFFVYSPLKIRYEDLMNMRHNKKFFKLFEIDEIEILNDSTTRVTLEWTENIPNARLAEIELTLQRKSAWKIIGAKWKTF